MRARAALKLHNRDEVQVRIDGRVKNGKATLPFGRWVKGHVVGVPWQEDWGVEVDVQTKQEGLLLSVPHTNLR